LLSLYTKSLGENFAVIVAIAAFTTMFSTTLTTLDASPRAMAKTSALLAPKVVRHTYIFWMRVLVIGTVVILKFFSSEMGVLIKTATILSFLTAPFYAVANYILISSKHTPKAWHPSLGLKIFSIIGILSLLAFSVWYVTILL
jgi:Mn2+/Fe2+ NRAMP family transporter